MYLVGKTLEHIICVCVLFTFKVRHKVFLLAAGVSDKAKKTDKKGQQAASTAQHSTAQHRGAQQEV